MSLDDHLRPDQNIRLPSAKGIQDLLMSVLSACRIRIHTQNARHRKGLSDDLLKLLRARLKATDIFGATGRTDQRFSRLIATIVTAQDIPAVQTQ